MLTDESRFHEWISTASDAEKSLLNRIYELQHLFDDMLFRKGSCTHEAIAVKSKMSGEEEWFDDEMYLPEFIEYFDYDMFIIRVEDLRDGIRGYYRHDDQTLCINSKDVDNERVLLHEMIHLHEEVINELPVFYHEVIMWSLYQDLRSKIHGLDEAIMQHCHTLNQWNISAVGGIHDALFLLKSFDIDLKCNYPLGTICGYDATEDFSYLVKA